MTARAVRILVTNMPEGGSAEEILNSRGISSSRETASRRMIYFRHGTFLVTLFWWRHLHNVAMETDSMWPLEAQVDSCHLKINFVIMFSVPNHEVCTHVAIAGWHIAITTPVWRQNNSMTMMTLLQRYIWASGRGLKKGAWPLIIVLNINVKHTL